MTPYLIAALIFGAAGWLAYARTTAVLITLRANAYLTDKDGVRRRYEKVSQVVRDKAEGKHT